MGSEIYIEPEDVFEECKKLKETKDEGESLVAEDTYFEVQIRVGWLRNGAEPYAIVYIGDKIEECCDMNMYDCADVMEQLYSTYLYDYGYYPEAEEEEDKCESREEELFSAFDYFMGTALENSDYKLKSVSEDEEMYNDCMNAALNYIAKRWGISIYRPIKVPDENGEIKTIEYPYSSI